MNHRQLKILLTALALFFAACGLILSLRPKQANTISRSDFLLNTFVTVTLYDSEDTALLEQCMALCREYENRLSKTIETSEIYRLNHRSPNETSFTLSEDTAALIRDGLFYSKLSGGAFDITVEHLSSLWDFTSGKAVIPPGEDIKAAVAKTGWQNLKLEGNTLTFLSPDTTIDLGAIAKGFIADRLKEYLESKGVKSAIINLGGNVLCVGKKPDGSPFRIGLQKPFDTHSEMIADLNIDDLSVVSSGVYERHFVLDGKNYHHILNPKTGYPYESDLVAVTIVSPNSVDGDALSTTCFSLGTSKGIELLNSIEHTYGYFITADGQIHYSNGAKALINK